MRKLNNVTSDDAEFADKLDKMSRFIDFCRAAQPARGVYGAQVS